jgi:hypothetical protein
MSVCEAHPAVGLGLFADHKKAGKWRLIASFTRIGFQARGEPLGVSKEFERSATRLDRPCRLPQLQRAAAVNDLLERSGRVLTHIVIATPCFGGQVTAGYMNSVIALMERAKQLGHRISLDLLANDALVTRARASLVASFLDRPDATHLLFIDADISFPAVQVERLIAFDRDMTAATYPVKAIHWDAIPNRHVHNAEPLAEAGLVYVGKLAVGEAAKSMDRFVTAEYAGTGFLMIKRAAIARMVAAYPQTKFTAVQSFPPSPPSEHLYALFDCAIEDGAYLSEDYAFCRRWRAIGGEIWLDTTSRLTHTGPYGFAGNAASRFATGEPHKE